MKETKKKNGRNTLPALDRVPDWERDWFAAPLAPFGISGAASLWDSGIAFPRASVSEKDGTIVVSADLPGMDKKDLDVRVGDDSVTISVRKSESSERHGRNFQSSSRSETSYYHAIPLPKAVVSSSARAVYKDGILKITLKEKAGSGKLKIE